MNFLPPADAVTAAADVVVEATALPVVGRAVIATEEVVATDVVAATVDEVYKIADVVEALAVGFEIESVEFAGKGASETDGRDDAEVDEADGAALVGELPPAMTGGPGIS